ncbi:hypothetical protein Pcinc_026550 [Petrolisthes cinctipes]|uniref:Uncharacterized protein n=1 Tax=Petrolisthes cinctipes TaxID=88211 RepID=A0AAE1F6A4_PETCI|nr:hypothetical protein Pcinc_026550 [Petrolisthes cinctipes]
MVLTRACLRAHRIAYRVHAYTIPKPASRVSGGALSSSRLMLATWRPQAQRPTFCFGNFPSYRSSSAAAAIICSIGNCDVQESCVGRACTCPRPQPQHRSHSPAVAWKGSGTVSPHHLLCHVLLTARSTVVDRASQEINHPTP